MMRSDWNSAKIWWVRASSFLSFSRMRSWLHGAGAWLALEDTALDATGTQRAELVAAGQAVAVLHLLAFLRTFVVVDLETRTIGQLAGAVREVGCRLTDLCAS